MTIAIDGRALQGALGGIDVYVRRLLAAVFDSDPDTTYIVFFNGTRLINIEFLSHYKNVRILQTRIPSKLFNASLFFLHRPFLDVFIQRATGKAIDVYVMPNVNFASFSRHAKIVLVAHDFSFLHYKKYQSFRQRLWHAAINPRRLMTRADHIIAVSESCKTDAIALYGLFKKSITVIPLGIDDAFFSTVHPVKEQLPLIVAFSPQEGRKNNETLIEAFALAKKKNSHLDEAILVLAGVTAFPARLRNLIRALAIEESVRIVPYVPLNRRHRLFVQARLCVYPSIYEGFGMPPLEALAAGLPVIAGVHSSIPHVSGCGIWYCDPYNICELSESLITLYANDKLRKQMIDRGRHMVTQYRWEKTAEQTMRVCTKLCE